MTETFYELLGVPEDASTADIEAAYRAEIKQVHPDVNDDVDAGERTKRLNRAKRVLTDESERDRYDREGHVAYTGDDADGATASTWNGTRGGGSSATVDRSGANQRGNAGPDGGGGPGTEGGWSSGSSGPAEGGGSSADNRGSATDRRGSAEPSGKRSGTDGSTGSSTRGASTRGNRGTDSSTDPDTASRNGGRSGSNAGEHARSWSGRSSRNRRTTGRTGSPSDRASASGGESSTGTWAGRDESRTGNRRRPWRSTATDRGGDDGNTGSGRNTPSGQKSGGSGDDGQNRGVGRRSERDEGTGGAPGDDGRTRTGARSSDRTGPSRPSEGPSWQANRPGRFGAAARSASGRTATGGSGTRASASAPWQSPAGGAAGSTAEQSWNPWERTREWAVRRTSTGGSSLDLDRLLQTEHALVLLATTFLLYPFFVFSVLFPAFPLVARVAIGLCTLLMFAYLLSVPEVAIVVFGLWSLIVPVAMVVVPGVGVFSLAGVVGLTVTWVPFGLALLTASMLRS